MADTKGNPGGLAHKLDARYRDDGDGTYSETEASNTWLWDATDLTWIKASVDHSTGALKVSVANTSISLSAGTTVSLATASTAAITSVSSTSSSSIILAANSARLGASIFNDSTQNLYVKFGTTASNTSYTVMMYPSTYYEVPFNYTGRIDGIWASANGNARVTELSP